MQREKPPEWREKQKGSRGIRRGQRYRLVFQFPIREQRLKPHYPEIWLRIDQGSAPSVSVTGARNDKDKERILSLLEEIWQDDSWLPAA